MQQDKERQEVKERSKELKAMHIMQGYSYTLLHFLSRIYGISVYFTGMMYILGVYYIRIYTQKSKLAVRKPELVVLYENFMIRGVETPRRTQSDDD